MADSISPPPYRVTNSGVVLTLRVTPRGGAARVDGLGRNADGHSFLKLRVSEAAEKGKANDAVIKLLAKEWRLARSSLAIVAGANDRNKLLEIRGDPNMLSESIAVWCKRIAATIGRTEEADE